MTAKSDSSRPVGAPAVSMHVQNIPIELARGKRISEEKAV